MTFDISQKTKDCKQVVSEAWDFWGYPVSDDRALQIANHLLELYPDFDLSPRFSNLDDLEHVFRSYLAFYEDRGEAEAEV